MNIDLTGQFLLVFLGGAGAGYLAGRHRWEELAIAVVIFAAAIGFVFWQTKHEPPGVAR